MRGKDEINARADTKREKLFKSAKLPSAKGLEDFEFTFQPSINKREIIELATCQFLEKATNLLFIGPPGTGKTHLAVAIAHQALSAGKTVLFTGTHLRRDTVIPQWFQASKAAAASDGHAVHCWVTAVIFQLSRLKRIP